MNINDFKTVITMKKITTYICLVLAMGMFTQCSDILDTTNPGLMDDDFAFSSPEEAAKTLSWAYGLYRTDIASGGNYNWEDPIGTDAEYMTELNTENNIIARLDPTAATVDRRKTQYDALNVVLGRAARIANTIEQKKLHKANQINEWTQLYGEAKTLWALCGWKLVRHFGDVPFGYENKYVDDYELTSRFDIIDRLIEELKNVESLMYKVGEGGITAERLNRSYANALIGEIALHAGSWQTIRTDMPGLYGNVQFEYKGEDDGTCVYARRKDYMDYLKIAEQYLHLAINTHNGTVRLITTDSRATNNPYQVHWQEINSRRSSPESFYEIACAPGNGGEHPYSQGRAGSNNGAVSVLNTFAAIRIIPTFFYTGFTDDDKRRDVSMVVTGSDAATGRETLIPLGAGTRISGGGPCINKWDMNRGDDPLIANNQNRNSGMNYTVLRMSDAMLMLAEAKAQTGDSSGALSLINQIRARAFGDNNHALSGLSGEALLDAVYAERKLELLGEGTIRYDMIRSGKFNERAVRVRQEMDNMMEGLKANGYYTFANGKTISNYIWTKYVQVTPGSSVAVVTQECTDKNNPALYPGWRGIFNWNAAAHASITAKNLAIKGLYNYIAPGSTEALALEADGYTQTDWAITMLTGTNPSMYGTAILVGIIGRENKAPRYYHPIPLTVIEQSNGKVTNGYGLPNK